MAQLFDILPSFLKTLQSIVVFKKGIILEQNIEFSKGQGEKSHCGYHFFSYAVMLEIIHDAEYFGFESTCHYVCSMKVVWVCV